MTRLVMLVFPLLLTTSNAPAQEPNSGAAQAPVARNAYGMWAGVSLSSPGGIFLGRVTGRQFFVAGLRYQRLFLKTGTLGVAYTAELIPVAVVTDNPNGPGVRATVRGANPEFLGQPGGTVYGAGIAPLGVELAFFHGGPVSLLVGGSGGLLAFEREVPFGNARKLNLTFDIFTALRVPVGRSLAPIVGYRFHHLSNAGTADFNPGLDARVWFAGLMVTP